MSNEMVLIKGSRKFGFEQITAALSLRVHETTLDVNLEAIAENLNFYRSFMKPETKITCMVKASAYGAGSVEIAKTLQDRGVDYLAVAVADEGADLRRAGITTGIIVMNPEMTAFNTLSNTTLSQKYTVSNCSMPWYAQPKSKAYRVSPYTSSLTPACTVLASTRSRTCHNH